MNKKEEKAAKGTTVTQNRRHVMCICCFFIIFFSINGYAQDTVRDIISGSPYSVQEKEMLESCFAGMEQDGIPARLVISRLKEGIAKKVAFQRVLDVLKTEQQLFLQARTILRKADPSLEPESGETIWIHTRLLLSANVPESHVVRITAACVHRWQDFRFITEMYVSLTKWGLDGSDAVEIAEAALSSSLPGKDFAGIPDLFIKARVKYISPDKVKQRILQEIPRVKSIMLLEERVLY